MKSSIAILALMSLLMAPAALADVQYFDFTGQAIVPSDIGEMLSMYGVIITPSAPTWDNPLPLDHDTYQYTVVITDLEFASQSGLTRSFVNGSLKIYEDDATEADYDDHGTFTDGTVILEGVISEINLNTNPLIPTQGPIQGFDKITWTGGTRLNDMSPDDWADWDLHGLWNTANALPGYTQGWTAKILPPRPIVNAQQHTLTAVKELMR